MTPRAERQLLRRYAARRDAEAFAEIAHRYQGLVYGTCLRVLGDAAAAQEAATECFFQLARGAGQVRGPLADWLHGCAVCTAGKMRSRRTLAIERRDGSVDRRPGAGIVALPPLDLTPAAMRQDLRVALVDQLLPGRSEWATVPASLRYELGKLALAGVGRARCKPVTRPRWTGAIRLAAKDAGLVAATVLIGVSILYLLGWACGGTRLDPPAQPLADVRPAQPGLPDPAATQATAGARPTVAAGPVAAARPVAVPFPPQALPVVQLRARATKPVTVSTQPAVAVAEEARKLSAVGAQAIRWRAVPATRAAQPRWMRYAAPDPAPQAMRANEDTREAAGSRRAE